MDFKWIEADTNVEDFVPVHKESLIKCDAKGDVETNSNARKEIENSEVKKEQKLLMCLKKDVTVYSRGTVSHVVWPSREEARKDYSD